MSREGYEQLGSDEYVAPQPAPGPTLTQAPSSIPPPLPAAQGLGAAPVLGVPMAAGAHYPQQQQQAPHQFAGPPHVQLPVPGVPHQLLAGQLPSAVDAWRQVSTLMAVWLGFSIASLILSLISINNLGTVAAICGIVGSSMHRCACCRGADNIASSVKTMHGTAIASAVLSGLVSLFSLLVSFGLSSTCADAPDPQACAGLTEVTLLYGLWYAFYTGLSGTVARRAGGMRRMLNPVSSGIVAV